MGHPFAMMYFARHYDQALSYLQQDWETFLTSPLCNIPSAVWRWSLDIRRPNRRCWHRAAYLGIWKTKDLSHPRSKIASIGDIEPVIRAKGHAPRQKNRPATRILAGEFRLDVVIGRRAAEIPTRVYSTISIPSDAARTLG
jgi:hypothetical protein